MKDHEIALSVNQLTAIARQYGESQQLREHLSRALQDILSLERKHTIQYAAAECAKVAGRDKDHTRDERRGAGICEFHLRSIADQLGKE